uniref:Uncharacterized protein n=1 Tax=Anguilla anguilla TaxID=7936 RepID=A0A0E9UXD9_ANGAN
MVHFGHLLGLLWFHFILCCAKIVVCIEHLPSGFREQEDPWLSDQCPEDT